MTTEKDLYQALKRTFPRIDFTRIETMTESGIPDINYCTENGIEGWIELKIGVPRLKPSQVAWHTRAIANKRRVFILTVNTRMVCFLMWRTNQFRPLDRHFTPNVPALISCNKLDDISICLTRTY